MKLSDYLIVIGQFLTLLGAFLAPVFIARFSKSPEEKRLDLQEKEISVQERSIQAAKDAFELTGMTGKQLAEALAQLSADRKEREALNAKNTELEKRITEIENDREKKHNESEIRYAELTQKHEDLEAAYILVMNKQAEDVKETAALRQAVVELDEKYKRQRRINEKLVKALNDANIPMPDMNGDLTDSVLKWKAPK